MPFMRDHYFGVLAENGTVSGGFSPNRKAVILSLLTRLKIYDEQLFNNFTVQLGTILKQAMNSGLKGEQASHHLEKALA
jgi:hypothetical protein